MFYSVLSPDNRQHLNGIVPSLSCVARFIAQTLRAPLIGCQLARAAGSPLASRRRRAKLPLALHQLDGTAVVDPEVPGRRPAGMTDFYEARNPHPQIQGVALGHDP